MIVNNLALTLTIDWSDIFLRISGDLPALWNPVMSSIYTPSGTSNPGFHENGNGMDTHFSDTGSF